MWRERAACAGEDTAIFYQADRERPGPLLRLRMEKAKAICARCPVWELCLSEALRKEAHAPTLRFGIWGGLTPEERSEFAQVSA